MPLTRKAAETIAELEGAGQEGAAQRDALSRALKLLVTCSSLLIHAENETELLNSICHLAVETAGYTMAWVGFVGTDPGAPIGLRAQFGGDDAFITNALSSPSHRASGPSPRAVRSGKSVVIDDYQADPDVKPWREMAGRRGYRSSIACPLFSGKKAIGVMSIYAPDPQAFSSAEVKLLEDLASNLSYGIAALRTRAENEQVAAILREKQHQLEESESRYRELLENLQAGVVVCAPDARIIFTNARASELLGLPQEQLQGMGATDPAWCFIDEGGAIVPVEKYPVNIVLATLKPVQAQLLGVRRPGANAVTWILVSSFPNFAANGKLKQVVVNFNDISARKEAEQKVHQMAFFDILTRLPNRRLLMDRLHAALATSARNHYYGALLFIDLDKFKSINDVRGHLAGDQLLVAIGERIRHLVREEDTVARLGGDEFVVLLPEISTELDTASQNSAIVAEKIRRALNVPFDLDGNVHHTSPSIGGCMFQGLAETPEALLRQADMAMYKAKDAGRNTFCFFSSAMQRAVESHAALEADLRHAVANRKLHLHYQLQVDAGRRPVGAEALARWEHDTRGPVSPLQFIPIAEESALILDIGDWVLETACTQLAKWHADDKLSHLSLAVNVSAQQFRQDDFVETIAAVLARHAFHASRLKLELTESVIVDDVDDVISKMHRLRAMGVSLSMDDFGTGYSSLAYLKRLPLDQIKIDQGFTRDITTDPSDAVMVKTVIHLARNFHHDVIAEGVETQEQLDFLQRHGCMAYQGYLFGKPMPIEHFEALATQH
jgi:diguanylate cyclase (GGDEF)-like protein